LVQRLRSCQWGRFFVRGSRFAVLGWGRLDLAEGLGPGVGEGAVVLPVGDFGGGAEAGLELVEEGLARSQGADEGEFVEAVAKGGVCALELLGEFGDF